MVFSRQQVRNCIQEATDYIGHTRPTPDEYKAAAQELNLPVTAEEIWWEYDDWRKAVTDAHRHREEK